MPSIAVRRHGPDGTPQYGNGALNYLYDNDAIAQIISDTLALELGSWWENLNLGVPILTKIIGSAPIASTITMVIKQAVLGLPYVTSVNNVTVSFDRSTRQVTYDAAVYTAFGVVQSSGAFSTASI